jgi:hypothetical protein
MKPITLTEEMKTNIISRLTEAVNKLTKITSNKLTFSADVNQEAINKPKAKIYIDSDAYLKMMLYIRDTSTEIAWHGTVERQDNIYYIKDVFLYPQIVTGATVNTDQEEYQNWLMDLTDEQHNSLRFQGHSHVNFGVTPSGTDTTFYQEILQVLPKDDFYIFMIMNKSGDTTFLIYDLAQNVMYENADIEYDIVSEETGALLADIKKEKEENCAKHNYQTISKSSFNMPFDYDTPWDTPKTFPIQQPTQKQETKVDDILEDIDKKWQNATLKSKKKGKKK